jgi:hypothetical protein
MFSTAIINNMGLLKEHIDDNALDMYKDLIEDKDEAIEDEVIDEVVEDEIFIINTIHVVYVLLGVCYSYLFWHFITKVSYNCIWAINYMFEAFWNSLDKGEEWIQIACIVSTIWVIWCVFQFASESNDRIDNYIDKLKSEHADLVKEKDAIIAGLEKELGRGSDYDSDSEYDSDSDSDSDSEINYDFDSDSDYDPDEDEY